MSREVEEEDGKDESIEMDLKQPSQAPGGSHHLIGPRHVMLHCAGEFVYWLRCSMKM